MLAPPMCVVHDRHPVASGRRYCMRARPEGSTPLEQPYKAKRTVSFSLALMQRVKTTTPRSQADRKGQLLAAAPSHTWGGKGGAD